MHNFSYWMENLFTQLTQGYTIALGVLFWPVVFTGVIAYVYLKQQSYVAGAVAALLLLALFSNYMAGVEIWVSLIYILVSLAFTGLILIFLSKRRMAE